MPTRPAESGRPSSSETSASIGFEEYWLADFEGFQDQHEADLDVASLGQCNLMGFYGAAHNDRGSGGCCGLFEKHKGIVACESAQDEALPGILGLQGRRNDGPVVDGFQDGPGFEGASGDVDPHGHDLRTLTGSGKLFARRGAQYPVVGAYGVDGPGQNLKDKAECDKPHPEHGLVVVKPGI